MVLTVIVGTASDTSAITQIRTHLGHRRASRGVLILTAAGQTQDGFAEIAGRPILHGGVQYTEDGKGKQMHRGTYEQRLA